MLLARLCCEIRTCVPSAAAASASAPKNLPIHKIDINLAGAKELLDLPGAGLATAKAIMPFRTKSGRLDRVEELLAIRGIFGTNLSKRCPYIAIGSPAAAPKKSAPASRSAAPPPNHSFELINA
jgi:predicted DNA-binding helix-hairpin-helix protein